jgi:hypothetical protein
VRGKKGNDVGVGKGEISTLLTMVAHVVGRVVLGAVPVNVTLLSAFVAAAISELG